MLTINVKNGARETVFEATEVSLMESAAQGNHIPAYDDRTLWCYPVKSGGEIREVSAGEVFVMNADGRTVAKYRLGEETTQGRYRDPREPRA